MTRCPGKHGRPIPVLEGGRSFVLAMAVAVWGALAMSGCTNDPAAPEPEKAAEAADEARAAGKPQQPISDLDEALPAADRSAAHEVLEAMVAVYRNAESYQDRAFLRLTARSEGPTAETETDRIEQQTPFSVVFERPSRIRLDAYGARMTSDGERLQAMVEQVPGQALDIPAPAALSLDNVLPDPTLEDAAHGFAGPPPQLLLLLEADSAEVLLGEGGEARLLGSDEIEGREHELVEIRRDGDEPVILWVDRQSRGLRRLEFPTEMLHRDLENYYRTSLTDLSLVAEFVDVRFDAFVDPAAYRIEEAAEVPRLPLFTRPSPALLLGEEIGPFSFDDVQESDYVVTRESLAGRAVVLEFWATWCGACSQVLPVIEEAYQQLKDDDRVVFVAVSVDEPDVTDAQVAAALEDWGVTIPPLRDPQHHAAQFFHVSAIPTLVVLGPDGTVQYVDAGIDTRDVAAALPEIVGRVLDGEDVYEEARQRFLEELSQRRAYWESLRDAANQGAVEGYEIPRPEIAPESRPERLVLTPAWESTDVYQPGNILVVAGAEGPRLLVIEHFRDLAEFSADGEVVARHALDLPENEVISFIRTGVAADGSRLFAVAAEGRPQVFLLDGDFEVLAAYPAAADSPALLNDVAIADLSGEGVPAVYVGYWGSAGVHAVSPGGERLWSNRAAGQALRLGVTGPDREGFRGLVSTNERGTLLIYDASGEVLTEVPVPDRPIHWLAAADLTGHGQPEWVALAGKVDEQGTTREVVVGIDLVGEELWSYELPPGAPQELAERGMAGRIAPQEPGCWIFVGADGSLHFLASDGTFLDRFHVGAPVRGVATVEHGEEMLLVVSTPAGVRAWQIDSAALTR